MVGADVVDDAVGGAVGAAGGTVDVGVAGVAADPPGMVDVVVVGVAATISIWVNRSVVKSFDALRFVEARVNSSTM